ncbi:myocardin-related transcription factor A-like, partial [Notolabrus celidotus]|uniref:myocardin-related transcription factor A-like n=1 Tax=Notolabrus celidotus TaxID=1203425 RepID=UPI00148F4C4A
HAILPAPAKPQTDQQLSPSSSSPPPVSAPSHQERPQGYVPLVGIKPTSLPPHLDEMKVAELKSELKLRSLPVSGTKTDLIERLRSYQEVNGGRDTTSFLAAGGVTGLTTTGGGKASRTAATTTTTTINNNNNEISQQQQEEERQSRQSAHSESRGTTASSSPTAVSLSSTSPGDRGFKRDQTEDVMGSPHTQLSLQACSAALFPANIKKEQTCSTSAPCRFSLKPAACLQKHGPVSSTGSSTANKALTADKDRMLQEKDKQIEELTRMLRQIQRVVELLRTQLERRRRDGQVHEPLVLLRVKQEPPDKPSDPLSRQTPVTCGLSGPNVKQESTEAEETTEHTPDAHGLTQASTQTRQTHELIHLRIQPEQTISPTKQHSHHQQTRLNLLQQQAAQRHLLQQQKQMLQMIQNQQNLQEDPQERKRKSHKLQQRPPRSDIYLEPQWNLNQTAGHAPLTQEPPKRDSTQTVTDNNGNHFLIALTNHRTDAPESNATNHAPLQEKYGGLQVSLDKPQQEVTSPTSTPETSGRNVSFPPTQTDETSLSEDVLFSPVTPASIETSHNEDSGQEEELIDNALQTEAHQDSLNPSLSIPPCFDPPQPPPSVQPGLQTRADTTDEKQLICFGRLEDFLESTTGKPLLGVEPGGALTLIDDLHSQMLCSSSILDHPPSPRDGFDRAAEGERGPEGMDWLDLDVGGMKGEESVTLDPLGPQSPPSVFSTDFLDSADLQIHWDSCL